MKENPISIVFKQNTYMKEEQRKSKEFSHKSSFMNMHISPVIISKFKAHPLLYQVYSTAVLQGQTIMPF